MANDQKFSLMKSVKKMFAKKAKQNLESNQRLSKTPTSTRLQPVSVASREPRERITQKESLLPENVDIGDFDIKLGSTTIGKLDDFVEGLLNPSSPITPESSRHSPIVLSPPPTTPPSKNDYFKSITMNKLEEPEPERIAQTPIEPLKVNGHEFLIDFVPNDICLYCKQCDMNLLLGSADDFYQHLPTYWKMIGQCTENKATYSPKGLSLHFTNNEFVCCEANCKNVLLGNDIEIMKHIQIVHLGLNNPTQFQKMFEFARELNLKNSLEK
ncbi:hypothetical protein BC833DRAFT_601974 [Globomyces pollinis-pini]|nr:hypothetical protein BC833DRAFT_601974 [Globomyces pollinis-pini]